MAMVVVDVFILYFNSQPHKEADPDNGEEEQEGSDFNSQPHKEADSNNVVPSFI